MGATQLEFLTEITESLNKDVTRIDSDMASLKELLEAQPPAKDYSLQLERIAERMQGLEAQVAKAVAASAAVIPVQNTSAVTPPANGGRQANVCPSGFGTEWASSWY